MLLASRPGTLDRDRGILLDILQCTGQAPTKKDPAPDVNSVKAEKPSYVPRH